MTTVSNDKRAFNALTPKEWTKLSRSVWKSREVSSAREKHHLERRATFSAALAERAIKMYSRPGNLVLDPFLEVGTTIVAARKLGRRGVGIELYRNRKQKWVADMDAVIGDTVSHMLVPPLNDVHIEV